MRFFLNNKKGQLIFVLLLSLFSIFFATKTQAAVVNTSIFNSKIENFGAPVYFDEFSWTATINAGITDVTMQVRTGSTAVPTSDTDSNWTAWTTVTSGTLLGAPLDGKQYFQYRATLTSQNINYISSLDDVQIKWSFYDPVVASLISSPYDSQDGANAMGGAVWNQGTDLLASSTFKLYLRTGIDVNSLASSTWVQIASSSASGITSGCTIVSGLVTCSGAIIPADMKDGLADQWFQYKVELYTAGFASPVIGEVIIKYVVNAPPEVNIKNIVSQSSGGVVMIDYDVRDIDTNTGVTPGKLIVGLQYCTSNCENIGSETWATATSTSLSGDFGSNVSISQGAPDEFTNHSLIWNPKIEYNGNYNTNFKVRLVTNDSEGANNITMAVSNSFTLDTTDPIISSFLIDSRSDATDTLIISVADDTLDNLQMRLSNRSDLSADGLNVGSGTWINYSATKNWNLSGSPETIYYQFKDKYGNISADGAISETAIPAQPSNIAFQDVSTVPTSDWREFVAWGAVDVPVAGFKQYNIYRSTDGVTYSLFSTQIDRQTNYILDANLDTASTYYYKITAEDNNGNISNYSSIVYDNPNGQGGSDLTSPNISGVAITNITTQSAVITWNTNEPSNSIVEYITSTGGNFTDAPSQGVATMSDNEYSLGKHSVIIDGLNPNQTYYIQVKSTDPSNNLATSKDGVDGYSFVTLNGPKISNVSASSIENKKATITWNTDVSSDSYIVYSANPDLTNSNQIGTSNAVNSHVVVLTGLTSGLKYYYYVKSGVAEDKNVVNGSTNYYTFTTTNDSIAPIITFATSTDITAITDTSALISWTTNESATSSISYGIDTSYASTSLNDNLNIGHSYPLTGLVKGTQYHFKLKNTDANGNSVASEDFTFITTDSSDTVAPVITFATSTDITNITNTSATISWITNETATSELEYGLDTSYGTSTSNANLNSSHSYILTDLVKGTVYHFRLINTDASGNRTTSEDYTFSTIDTSDYTPPVITFATSTDITMITDTSALISWTTNESATSSISYGIDTSYASSTTNPGLNTLHLYPITGLTKGTLYHIQLKNTDANGNTVISDDFTFLTTDSSDVTAPIITFDSLTDITSITNTSATISWITNEIATSSLEYGLDDTYGASSTNANLNSSHSYILTNLTKGTIYHFRLVNADANGNTSASIDYTFSTIDTSDYTPPVITFATSTDITEITNTSARISWITNEIATSSLEYGLDDTYGASSTNANLNSSHNYVLTGLIKGTIYHFRLINSDVNGNIATSTDYTFSTIDTSDYTPPVITFATSTDITNITDNSALIVWDTDESATSSIGYGIDTSYGSTTANPGLNTHHIYPLSGLTRGTIYHIQLKNTDANGNTVISDDFTFSTTDSSDITAPVITFATSTDITNITNTSATISWTTNEIATSSLEYGLDTSYGTSTSNANLNSSHSYILTNLTKGTIYHFRLINTDASGNSVMSDDYTFSTIDTSDYTPPVITFATSTDITEITNTSARISWVTNEIATSSLEYGLDNTYGASSTNANLNSSHSYVLTGLTKGTVYHFRLVNADVNGNIVTSEDYTFSTIDTSDYTPPVITFTALTDITGITDSSVLISWDTDEVATSSIGYGIDTSYGSTAANPGLNTHHLYSLTGLTKGTLYHLQLRNTDANGNTVVSEDITFSTTDSSDITAPVITFATSTDITNITNTSATISWKTNEVSTSSIIYSLDVAYDLSFDNNSLNSSHSYTLTGLTKNTLYHFRLVNTDASGNSVMSDDYTFSTIDTSDYTPPVITFTALTDITNITDSSVLISWDTDEVATSSIGYGIDTSYGSEKSNPGLNTHHLYSLTGLTKGTLYHLQLKNTDANGNTVVSEDITFSTTDSSDVTAPIITFATSTDITNITNTSATISWATNEVSTSELEYGLSESYSASSTNVNLNSSHSYTLIGLSKGSLYHFRLVNADASGNKTTSEDYTFSTIDTSDFTPPVITFATSTDITNITDTSAFISWITNESATSSIDYGTDTSYGLSLSSNNLNIGHSYSLTGLTKGTLYHIQLKNTDANGNTVISDDIVFTTTDSSDTVAPIITFDYLTDVTDITNTSATISWVTNEFTTSELEYGLSESYSASSTKTNLNSSHSYNLSNLVKGSIYHFRLINTDASGNKTTSEDYTFSTIDTSDFVPPVITFATSTGITNITDTSAFISWTTNEIATSSIDYGIDTSYGSSSVNNNLNTGHSYSLTGLISGTLYHIQLKNTDASGNIIVSEDFVFSTTEGSDAAEPLISEVSVNPVMDTVAILNWDTNKLTTSRIDYGIDATNLSSSTIDNNFNKTHSVTLNSLLASTKYYYKIIATDSKNIIVTNEGDFTTSEPLVNETEVKRREDIAKASVKQTAPSGGGVLIIDKTDTVAPKISDLQILSIRSDSAIISWKTDENADSYVDFGETVSYGKVAGLRTRVLDHRIVVNDLQPSTTYHYKVSSVDASGNYSGLEDATLTTISFDQELSGDINNPTESTTPIIPGDSAAVQMENAQNLFKMATQALQKAVGIIKSGASKMSLNLMETSLAGQQASIDELSNLLPVPVLGGEPGVLVTSNTATITWKTDKQSSSLIAYAADSKYNGKLTNPYTQVDGNSNEMVVSHSVVLTGLEPDTLYHYQLQSKATLGAAAKSSDFTFKTKPEELSIQKYVVNNLSNEEASFQWVTNFNSDSLIQYIPYKNNILDESQAKKKYNKNLTTIHELGLDDLSGGVDYKIVISSKDQSNKTIERVIDHFSTAKTDDAPMIDQVQTISAISPGKNLKIQTVVSWITNEPSTSKVYYKKGVAKEGDKLPEETKLDENYTKKHVVVITKFDSGSVYSFQTESTDYSGKVSLSKIYTILTPKQEESVFQVIVKNLEGVFGWVNQMK